MPGQQSQSVVKGERFGKKVMLCVWWNYEGLLLFELVVAEGRAVNADLYIKQLQQLHEVLQARYPSLVNWQ